MAGMGLDDDERGGGSIFGGGGGKGIAPQIRGLDSLDNLGSTQRRGGGERQRQRQPSRPRPRPASSSRDDHRAAVDKGFGFIRPQRPRHQRRRGLPTCSSAPGAVNEELSTGWVTFIARRERGPRARAVRIAPPPTARLVRHAGMSADRPARRRRRPRRRRRVGRRRHIRDIQRQQTTQNRHVSAAARFGGKLNTAPLLLLLRATSPEVVDRVFEASFRNRKALQLPAEEAMMTAKELKIDKPPKVHAPPRNSAQFLCAIRARNSPTRLRASTQVNELHTSVCSLIWSVTESPTAPSSLFVKKEVAKLFEEVTGCCHHHHHHHHHSLRYLPTYLPSFQASTRT